MQRIVICGATGRDFHNYNTVYRDDATMQPHRPTGPHAAGKALNRR